MAINSIPISGLIDFGSIATGDFIPLVDSSSLTTVRTSIQEFFAFMAITASCLSASNAITSSFSNFAGLAYNANSASQTTTASFAKTASLACTASMAKTASVALTSISASFATTVPTASFSLNGTNANNAKTASFLLYTGGFNGTASYSTTSSISTTASFSNTASYSITSSNSTTASFALTASFLNTSGATGFNFVEPSVIVASSPATNVDPQFSWKSIIRTDEVFLAPMNTTSDTYISLSPNNFAGNTSFHAYAAPGIPSNAKAVVLEGIMRNNWGDGASGNPIVLLARKNTSTSWMLVTGTTNGTSGHGEQTSVGQMVCPLHTDGTFQWEKTTGDNNSVAFMLRIVGYIV